MTRSLTDFDRMWQAYPNPDGTAEEAKKTIGGNADVAWITNTCVLRVSRSFNYAGHPIPRGYPGLETLPGADGLRYAYRVEEFRRYLLAEYGAPDLAHEGREPSAPMPDDLRGRRGVICFLVSNWGDATGHMDLWDGLRCAHKDYFGSARAVYLWQVPKPVVPRVNLYSGSLTGSVGQGGTNRKGDVQQVQRLLALAGHDPGDADGVAGARTIAAIRSFQRGFLASPDGRVDIGGSTWKRLSGA